ncbi:MAG: DUF1775 domain-containing protein [Gemmatimonadetes bacterium]|nr:DUF1775 domain-containing protein [Gemmatimonadota bacterium]
MRHLRLFAISLLIGAPAALCAQVSVSPNVTTPAAWERFAIRVINQTDTATVAVRVEVPEIIMLLGVQPKPGWTVQTVPATDSTPNVITWTGGTVAKGQFDEFAFLGRLDPNAKEEALGFPVQIKRANGSVVDWRKRPGELYSAPRVQIGGTVSISPAGQIALSVAAVGLAIVSIILTIALSAKRRTV